MLGWVFSFAKIYYTLDGTDPLTSDTKILYRPIFMASGLHDSPIRITKAWMIWE